MLFLIKYFFVVSGGNTIGIVARPALASATLADTHRALLNLLQRAKILTPKHES